MAFIKLMGYNIKILINLKIIGYNSLHIHKVAHSLPPADSWANMDGFVWSISHRCRWLQTEAQTEDYSIQLALHYSRSWTYTEMLCLVLIVSLKLFSLVGCKKVSKCLPYALKLLMKILLITMFPKTHLNKKLITFIIVYEVTIL